MSHFDDVIMPNAVRFGSATVPQRSTQQVFTGSGGRKANQLWSQGLRKLRLSYVRGIADIHEVLKIWEAMEGPVHSFLARDWNDWNTTNGNMAATGLAAITALDQPLRNTVTGGFAGDGVTKTFQAVKQYGVGATALHTRTIKKLQAGSLVAAVDGGAEGHTVDVATGIFTFTVAPGASVSPTAVPVTWGGAFYVPAHFLSDEGLEEELRSFKTGGLGNVELMEERL